jgi:type VI secretion system secreted protein VgrG
VAETQQDRRLQLTTPLGEDVLMITRFTGDEELSRSFSYELELASSDGKIAFNDIIGQNVTVKVEAEPTGKRYFNGFVSEFVQIEDADQLARYRAKVVPWLWFLTRVADCRIFQEKTVPEIIEAVFNSRHFNQYELRLTGSYPPLENCVQYRETDFNFVSRLMEQEGICYFFVHKDGGHTLVLADSPSAHDPCPDCESVSYYPWNLGHEFAGIRSWTRESRVCPGAFAHSDFDFKSPGKKLLADASDPKQHDHADYEIYDYPGEYVERSAGNNYSTIRMQELQTRHHVLRGEADIAGLHVGHNVTLEGAYRDEDNRKYLVTRLHHEIHSTPFGSESGTGRKFYQCRLSAIPATVEFRPQRLTPKPLITGPQTAIVTGPGGDEIHTDQYARVKVHFHWHRHDKSDEKSSCWTRVSQHWAGKQWGAIHIPRIGQEVIVEFLDGDPDRPIITGRVYNGDNPPPYELPANKTQSGVKSRSSLGGGTSDFNEIRMEDKKGSEQLYIHAEKNQDNVVENNETTSVGHDRTEDVGHDEIITIGNDRTETVGNNETITIGVNRTETVGSNETITIGGNRTETVGGNETITIGGNETRTVAGKKSETVLGSEEWFKLASSSELTLGSTLGVFVGAKYEAHVGSKVGAQLAAEINIVSGAKYENDKTLHKLVGPIHDIEGKAKINAKAPVIQLTGATRVQIKVGGSTITVASGGVVIKASKVILNTPKTKYTGILEGSDMKDT